MTRPGRSAIIGGMEVRLNYGREKLAVAIPDERVAAVLEKPLVPALADPAEAIRAALERPIAGRPLRDFCAAGKTACVVVSDITRPVPNPLILPILLGHLQAHGIRREDIAILIATGMHRPCEGAELIELLGRETAEQYRVVNHDPARSDQLETLGKTSRGTAIQVNRLYTRADLKILTGLIEPHFMAGYSGGRKAICPGISGLESLSYSHGVECLAHPRAANCVLAGNPFHEEALSAAQAAGCDFILNVALDQDRRVIGVFAGDLVAAHQAGCDFVGARFKARVRERQDVVLASNAGYPLDINFYQTVKGLDGALTALKPGGTILIASRCPEGIGSARFISLLEEMRRSTRLEDFLEAHRRHFVPDQWEVQKLIQVLVKARFLIYSEGLSAEEARLGGGEKVASVKAGLELAFARHGPAAKVIVIPEGPYLVPELIA